jgi:RNA polymerase sigma factor (sigma-70 family)
MKQKVRNQSTHIGKSNQDYHAFVARNSANGDAPESTQANADTLSEAAGYWHVDDATKEVQRKIRLMLDKAKQVLTDRQYNAFVLVDIKKLKLREAAKVMEINYQRVDQLVTRARIKLQGVYNAID